LCSFVQAIGAGFILIPVIGVLESVAIGKAFGKHLKKPFVLVIVMKIIFCAIKLKPLLKFSISEYF